MSRHRLLPTLSALALGACSVVGLRGGTKTPNYVVVEQLGPRIEVRHYDTRVTAEVVDSGERQAALRAGFQRLAAYIFGANADHGSIAMTAPVTTEPTEDGIWRIRFFLPAPLTATTAPQPNDPGVTLLTVPPQTIAVYRYSGLPTAAAAARAQRELRDGLGGSGWLAQGVAADWYYDPPWTLPPLRRNEAAVVVTRPPIPSASAPGVAPPPR